MDSKSVAIQADKFADMTLDKLSAAQFIEARQAAPPLSEAEHHPTCDVAMIAA